MWSVIILGLIKMLLKTVSFDHLAVYFISEEHNLKRKPNTSQIQWLRLSELVLDAKPEQTTWRLWTLLREELEPSHSRKVGSQGATVLTVSKQLEMLPFNVPEGRTTPHCTAP